MQKTWYHQQLEKYKEEIYPREELCDQLVEAKRYIDTHYYTNIRLQDLARKACLSKFHFIRLFKKLYGITPNQYLTSVRLENAKNLLQSGATVSTACFSVGFDSTTTFAGLFKKNTGSKPSSLYNRPLSPAAVPLIIFLKKQY